MSRSVDRYTGCSAGVGLGGMRNRKSSRTAQGLPQANVVLAGKELETGEGGPVGRCQGEKAYKELAGWSMGRFFARRCLVVCSTVGEFSSASKPNVGSSTLGRSHGSWAAVCCGWRR